MLGSIVFIRLVLLVVGRSSRAGLHLPRLVWVARPTNADRIRDGIDAFNRGDHEALLALVTEDVEWKRVDGLPDSGVIHGKEEVRRFLQPEVFAAGRLEPREIVSGDDVVLIHAVFHATGAASGIELDVETYAVYGMNAEGLVWRVENWRERADAERASGLRLR
jgi:ketosteroid isomerase-like protein